MIQRNEHNDNYTVIANETIRNPDLSDGAKILLLYMLTCSDDWSFSIKGLAYSLSVSEGVIKCRVKELKENGYIRTKKIQNKKGFFGEYDWEIFETPYIRSTEKPTSDKTDGRIQPTSDKTDGGYSDPIRNTNIKEISNSKEIPKERNIFRKPTFEEVQAYCLERNNGIDPEQFLDYYESKGWVVGKSKMKDWKACVRTWERNRKGKPTAIKPNPVPEESPFKKLLREEGYSI